MLMFASSIKVLFTCVMHVLNAAQFLNAAFVSLPTEVIFPSTKIHASEQSQRLDYIDLVKNFICSSSE